MPRIRSRKKGAPSLRQRLLDRAKIFITLSETTCSEGCGEAAPPRCDHRSPLGSGFQRYPSPETSNFTWIKESVKKRMKEQRSLRGTTDQDRDLVQLLTYVTRHGLHHGHEDPVRSHGSWHLDLADLVRT